MHRITSPTCRSRQRSGGPHVISPLHRTRQCPPPWLAPTTPDCAPWTIPHHTVCHNEIASWNAHPWHWLTWLHPKITCVSRDNHATMCHLCHLIGQSLSQLT